jgi:hypothetical protein
MTIGRDAAEIKASFRDLTDPQAIRLGRRFPTPTLAPQPPPMRAIDQAFRAVNDLTS